MQRGWKDARVTDLAARDRTGRIMSEQRRASSRRHPRVGEGRLYVGGRGRLEAGMDVGRVGGGQMD